jgi:hypothetical protein
VSGCSVIFLPETKKEYFDTAFIKSCCPPYFDDFLYIPLNGASDGFAIIWKSSMFTVIIMHCETFALSIHFTSTS